MESLSKFKLINCRFVVNIVVFCVMLLDNNIGKEKIDKIIFYYIFISG